MAYSGQSYEAALARWEEVAIVEPDNIEIEYYIDLLKKLLGLHNNDDKKNR